MYDYYIYTNSLSLIIIPPCCSEIRNDFIFHSSDISISFKDSLLFQCPKCLNTYPNINQLFKSWGKLLFALRSLNDKQSEYKKKGFFYQLSTNYTIYSFIDEIYNFNNLIRNPKVLEEHNQEELFNYTCRLLLVFGKEKTYKKFPSQPFLLSNLSVHCEKCDSHFHLKVGIEQTNKQIECPKCVNKSKVPKKLMEEFQLNYSTFQNQLIDDYKHRIIVVPFNVLGLYQAIVSGDIEISKNL